MREMRRAQREKDREALRTLDDRHQDRGT
jgi:hypothetical protein